MEHNILAFILGEQECIYIYKCVSRLSVCVYVPQSRKNGCIYWKTPNRTSPYIFVGYNVGVFILASEAISRPLEAISDLNLQKIIEGSRFLGYSVKHNMFLDPKLWEPGEVKSDLRGH